MPMPVRVMFPALACFGPLFMVIGLQGPGSGWSGHRLAVAGALMTSTALVLLFLVLARLCAAERR